MKQALSFKHSHIEYSRFSPQGIQSFLEGENVEPVSLFCDIRSYITRFVYFPDSRYLDLITVWVIGTYLFPVFRHYPYLWINAEKGSGKTTLLEVIAPICFNGQMLVSPTPAVLFREVSANRVTLLIDEFEEMTKHNKDLASGLLSVLNAGYNRDGQVKRVEPGKNGEYKTRSFNAYSPKAFSGISEIDEVLRDRTIQVRLLRKGTHNHCERYKITREVEEFQREIRDRCYSFALSAASQVASIYQSNVIEKEWLHHLNNRELDLWEPLVSILYVIDQGGFLGLLEPFLSLSQECFEEKSNDNLIDNDTSKIILGLQTLLGSNVEFEETTEQNSKIALRRYRASEVVSFFSRMPELEIEFLSQKELTTRLKALQIKTERVRINGNERCVVYIFSPEQVDELMDRFNIKDV